MKKNDETEFPEIPRFETRADLGAYVDRLARVLEHERLGELVSRLARLPEKARRVRGRTPFGLIRSLADVQGGYVLFSIQTQVPCRMTHLVVSEETAEAFDLLHVFVGTEIQSPTLGEETPGGGFRGVPLEPFSVGYVSDRPELADVLAFQVAVAEPGVLTRLQFCRRRDAAPKPFRGVLWLETFQW